jgi:hypothetical protein
LPILDEKGFVIVAVNSNHDYVACASRLAHSIKRWSPNAKVCLISDSDPNLAEFDYCKILPYGDQNPSSQWKLANDWQAWAASPFRQTIKLEADMLICGPVDHWWTMLQHRDLCVSTGARTFLDTVSQSRFYRKTFDANSLPDVYSAIVYWRVCATAEKFWKLVRNIFENWSQYRKLLKFADEIPTTDVVYAMAAVIVGPETVTMPWASYPKIVHMKKHIIDTRTDDWTKELVWEQVENQLRIQTVTQWGAFHYNQKHWNVNDQQ